MIWMLAIAALGSVTPAAALQTCVTDRKTGSSSSTSDCATCEALGGCCYNNKGDCPATASMRISAIEAGFNLPGVGDGTASIDVVVPAMFYDLGYVGLSSAETATHVCGPAEPGQTAPVLYELPTGNHKVGEFDLVDRGEYSATAQLGDLLAGKWYVEVCTQLHPQGELRGHILLSETTAVPAASPIDQRLVLYPNPSAGGLRIECEVSTPNEVDLRILDATGREVAGMQYGTLSSGRHDLSWDGRTKTGMLAQAGVYFASVRIGEVLQTRRLILVR